MRQAQAVADNRTILERLDRNMQFVFRTRGRSTDFVGSNVPSSTLAKVFFVYLPGINPTA